MSVHHTPDAQLALALQREDHDNFVTGQKGKGRSDDLSDHDLTVALWDKELQSLEQSLADERLALSLSNAIATDQYVITQMQQEEQSAEQDRAMAVALAEDTDVPPTGPSQRHRDETKDVEIESVCEVIGSLAQLSISNGESSGRVEDESTAFDVPGGTKRCVSCMEDMKDPPMFLPPCNHAYCRDCLQTMFLAATRDEQLYPPRCCKNVFPPGIALRLLNYRELTEFSSRGIEFSCSERIYCGDPVCSTFIPPAQIRGQKAVCPRCKLATHVPCNSLLDVDHECPSDEALQQVLTLGEEEHWRRCPGCRTFVELGQGCNHITCRCGREFCYVCGSLWHTCDCPLWQEERLYGLANRIVDDEVAANAGEARRAEVLARAVQELNQHEDLGCEHARRWQWKYRARPNRQCEVCYHVLPEYIFECKSCRLLACNRCIRNRLR